MITAFSLCILLACNAPFHKNGFTPGDNSPVISFKSKKSVRPYVQPSEMFTNAFFAVREKRGEWPADFVQLNAVPEFKNAYEDLMKGLYSLSYDRMSKDSLVLNFEFSKSKYAQSRGYNNTYYPDLVKGKYIFYLQNKVRMFTVKL